MTEDPRRSQLKKGSAQRRSKRDRYTPVACNECKLRKVKCSGHSICRRCAKHGIPCVYDRMLPAELDASIASSNKDNIQFKLSRMQASIDSLFQTIKPHDTANVATQPAQLVDAVPSPFTDSRRGSDNGSNATVDDLAALVGIEDTMHRLSGMQNAMQLLGSQASPGNVTSILESVQHPLWPLSRNEALEVIDGFQEDIETLYPFVNLEELRDLLDNVYCLIPAQYRADVKIAGWSDMDDSRNLDFLKLIIACGLAARGKKENDLSRELITTVEEKNMRRINGLDIDMKDLAIATMLSVCCYQNDEITLAWRKIGAAARMCLELGLHKLSSPLKNEIATKQIAWVSKMFWCIYVLDRRYSFMTNLPFTFRDEDLDPSLPLPDSSSPFLLPMVSYGRLGAKIMPALPKLKSIQHPDLDDLDNDTCIYLGTEIDRWIQFTTLNPPPPSPTSPSHSPRRHFSSIDSQSSTQSNNSNLATFCRIRGNQMRLSLYKHALHSPTRIAHNPHFAHLAVACATDNIRILAHLGTSTKTLPLSSVAITGSSPNSSCHQASSPFRHHKTNNSLGKPSRRYRQPQIQHNFFLISSVAVLYLAIRNAPQQFSSGIYIHEYFSALNILRASALLPAASRRLRETVRTLERATWSLAGLGVGSAFVGAGLGARVEHGGRGGGGWGEVASFCGASFVVERTGVDAGLEVEERGCGDEEGIRGQALSWDGVEVGDVDIDDGGGGFCNGGGGGGHEFWTFTDDMGWLSPPDSYFLDSGSPSQNVLGYSEPGFWA